MWFQKEKEINKHKEAKIEKEDGRDQLRSDGQIPNQNSRVK